jgi:hypothetical protein
MELYKRPMTAPAAAAAAAPAEDTYIADMEGTNSNFIVAVRYWIFTCIWQHVRVTNFVVAFVRRMKKRAIRPSETLFEW